MWTFAKDVNVRTPNKKNQQLQHYSPMFALSPRCFAFYLFTTLWLVWLSACLFVCVCGCVTCMYGWMKGHRMDDTGSSVCILIDRLRRIRMLRYRMAVVMHIRPQSARLPLITTHFPVLHIETRMPENPSAQKGCARITRPRPNKPNPNRPPNPSSVVFLQGA